MFLFLPPSSAGPFGQTNNWLCNIGGLPDFDTQLYTYDLYIAHDIEGVYIYIYNFYITIQLQLSLGVGGLRALEALLEGGHAVRGIPPGF